MKQGTVPGFLFISEFDNIVKIGSKYSHTVHPNNNKNYQIVFHRFSAISIFGTENSNESNNEKSIMNNEL